MDRARRETIRGVPPEIPEILVPRLAPADRLVAIPAFRLLDAVTGARPGLSTAVRFGARGGDLHVRFDARHRGVLATLERDNTPLWTEDVVEIFLAADSTRYFEFEVNPLGARFSARVDSPAETREGMRVETFSCPRFSAVVRLRESTWSARLRIPFADLCGGVMPPLFRGNAFRIDRRAGEFSALSPTGADPPDFHRRAAFARFRLDGHGTGTGLE